MPATVSPFPPHCSWCDRKKLPPVTGKRQDITVCPICDLPQPNRALEPNRRDNQRNYRGPNSG